MVASDLPRLAVVAIITGYIVRGPVSLNGVPMPMSMMSMTFFTATDTPLFLVQFAPTSAAAYAGWCVFLAALSVVLRMLYAARHWVESYWLRERQSPAHPRPPSPANGAAADIALQPIQSDQTSCSKPAAQIEGENQPPEHLTDPPGDTRDDADSFSLKENLARAGLVTLTVFVAYLLMLAVMTMNVGYFLSVLGGTFGGELALGRWSVHGFLEHH